MFSGPHYCDSFKILISDCSGGHGSSCGGGSIHAPLRKFSARDEDAGALVAVADAAAVNILAPQKVVILLDKAVVRPTKVYLEGKGWLDKSSRICPAVMPSPSSSEISEVDLDGDLCVAALLLPLPRTEDEDDDHGRLVSPVPNTMMAVPVTEEFHRQLLSSSNGSPIREDLKTVICSNRLMLQRQACVPSKKVAALEYAKARDFLEHCLESMRLSPANMVVYKRDIPRTFELVGDVLMVPEGSLTLPNWFSADTRVNIWRELCRCYSGSGVTRVAKKAKIDSGPKRESRVRLLFNAASSSSSSQQLLQVGQPEQTGEGSEGWVVVTENKISFGFDITRVM